MEFKSISLYTMTYILIIVSGSKTTYKINIKGVKKC